MRARPTTTRETETRAIHTQTHIPYIASVLFEWFAQNTTTTQTDDVPVKSVDKTFITQSTHPNRPAATATTTVIISCEKRALAKPACIVFFVVVVVVRRRRAHATQTNKLARIKRDPNSIAEHTYTHTQRLHTCEYL